MRLLVTRPEADAVVFKARLIELGHQVTIDPLLTVNFEDADPIEIEGVQALIATSRNGLRALAQSPQFEAAKAITVFCVGPGTAATAKGLGLQRIIEGPATARDLVSVIEAEAEVNGGPLLHLAGDAVTAGPIEELRRVGFHVLQPVVYRTEVASRFASPTVASLRNNRIDGVILLSPRTAEVYANLVQFHRLTVSVREIVHLCVSRATTRPLEPLGLTKVSVAAAPNLQEVLALLASGATQSPV